MQTVEYAPGRYADVLGDPARPAVLVWHGKQPDARAAVRPLVERLAGHRLAVIAPDWNSHASDAGRADLLNSVRFTQDWLEDDVPVVLVGWSLGGVAAAGLTIHAEQFGFRPAGTVCLAGAFMAPDPISGAALPTTLPTAGHRAPFTLLHGVADDVVPVAASRQFAAVLTADNWPVEVVELDTDHGAIAGARYDPANDRYLPGGDPQTVAVTQDVAARIAAILS